MKVLEEVWVDIKDADGYLVSTFGEVMNKETEKLIKPQVTPNGIVYVPLYVHGEKVTRSVKVMVAKAFVDGRTKIFDTAINRDGNKLNNRADNLLWRPRWFAVKYSRQFNKEMEGEKKGPVREMETRTIFKTVRVAGIEYGLLFRDVFSSCRTGAKVFPTKQIFEFK